MNKYFVLVGFLVINVITFAQSDSTLSPSARFKIFPPAKFLSSDSLTIFSKEDLQKNKPVMLMVFNPECDHCQHETEELTKSINKFKGIQIVMSTMAPMNEMKMFIEKYKLDSYKNIIVVKDVSYFLPSYFQFHNLPHLAFYNKKHKLISEFSGTMPIEKILEEFGK